MSDLDALKCSTLRASVFNALHPRGTNGTTNPESLIEVVRRVLPWGKIIVYEAAGHRLMLEKTEVI